MVPEHKRYLSFLGGLILHRAFGKRAFYSSRSSELGLEFVCGNKEPRFNTTSVASVNQGSFIILSWERSKNSSR